MILGAGKEVLILNKTNKTNQNNQKENQATLGKPLSRKPSGQDTLWFSQSREPLRDAMSPSLETVHDLSGEDETLVCSFTSGQRLKIIQVGCFQPPVPLPPPAIASLKYDNYSLHFFLNPKIQNPAEARGTGTELASHSSQGLSRRNWRGSEVLERIGFRPFPFHFSLVTSQHHQMERF